MRAPVHFVVSGSLFALFHRQIVGLPSLILVGIFLSYLYYAFQSPYPSVLAHFVYNAVLVSWANYGGGLAGVLVDGVFTTPAILAGLGLVAGSLWFAEKRRRSARKQAQLVAGSRPARTDSSDTASPGEEPGERVPQINKEEDS
jgi:hypothetical protein